MRYLASPPLSSIKPSLSEQLKKNFIEDTRDDDQRVTVTIEDPLSETSVYDALARASQRP